MAEDSLFTKIVKGEIPAFKVYEDDKTLAFLDIRPIQPGHVLVVTKKQVETFEQLDDEDYQALFATVKKVARKIKQELQPGRVGVIIEGFEVAHAHVKVFPINNEKELRRLPASDEKPDFEALKIMADRLRIGARS